MNAKFSQPKLISSSQAHKLIYNAKTKPGGKIISKIDNEFMGKFWELKDILDDNGQKIDELKDKGVHIEYEVRVIQFIQKGKALLTRFNLKEFESKPAEEKDKLSQAISSEIDNQKKLKKYFSYLDLSDKNTQNQSRTLLQELFSYHNSMNQKNQDDHLNGTTPRNLEQTLMTPKIHFNQNTSRNTTIDIKTKLELKLNLIDRQIDEMVFNAGGYTDKSLISENLVITNAPSLSQSDIFEEDHAVLEFIEKYESSLMRIEDLESQMLRLHEKYLEKSNELEVLKEELKIEKNSKENIEKYFRIIEFQQKEIKRFSHYKKHKRNASSNFVVESEDLINSISMVQSKPTLLKYIIELQESLIDLEKRYESKLKEEENFSSKLINQIKDLKYLEQNKGTTRTNVPPLKINSNIQNYASAKDNTKENNKRPQTPNALLKKYISPKNDTSSNHLYFSVNNKIK